MSVNIIPVESKKDLLNFVKLEWKFYKDDPYFVPPVVADRMKTLDKDKNPLYKHTDYKCFIAKKDGESVGRIAAIVNGRHLETHKDELGFFGFFECVNDQEVADKLYDAAEYWLAQKGMKAMRGPVNPTMNDEAGLLVDGFEDTPRILMPYNPKYYEELITAAGIPKRKDLYAYALEYHKYVTPKLERMQEIIRKRYKVTLRDVDFKNKKQFWKDVDTLKEIYNSAWTPNWGFVKMTDEEFDFLASDLKMFAEPSLVFIAELDGKPAGFCLALPDINLALRYNKSGSLLGALWRLKMKKKLIDKCRIIALGVKPEYQKFGIDGVMYYEVGKRAKAKGMPFGEASWVLEDNFEMNRGLTQTMNGHLYKTYRLYEKKF